MLTAKQFVSHVEDSLSKFYLSSLEESTEQWRKRNEGDTISGSGFSKCLRLCYYRWFDRGRTIHDPAQGDNLDIKSQRNMFYGLEAERWLIEALKLTGIPGGGLVHKEQDGPPVVLTSDVSVNGVTITRSAANDMVIECLGDDKGRYYIPVECKTTDRNFPQRVGDKWISPQSWWEDFTGYDDHKRQLMQWIWLAHQNNMVVPFGILFYQRRGTLETKYIVIAVDAVNLERFNGANSVVDYYNHEEELNQRNLSLVDAIGFNVLPAYDPTISKKVCDSCVYQRQCEATR